MRTRSTRFGMIRRSTAIFRPYLFEQTDIEFVTTSTLPENRASADVPEKNGFALVVRDSPEDWGYEAPLPADKWIR